MFKSLRKNNGSSVLTTIIVVLVLVTLGGIMAYFIAINQHSRMQQVTRDRSTYAAHGGVEYALRKTLVENSPDTFYLIKFARGTIAVSKIEDKIISQSEITEARASQTIANPNASESVSCLDIDITDAEITGGNTFTGIELSRNESCGEPVYLSSLDGTTWSPNIGEKITSVSIVGKAVVYDGPPAGSGEEIEFGTVYVINDSSNHVLSMSWDGNVDYHNLTLRTNYSYDGGVYTKSTNINFLANVQANCFDWDVSNAYLERGEKLNELKGIILKNTCAAPLMITELKFNWTPENPERSVTSLKIGDFEFNGSKNVGDDITINKMIPGSGNVPFELIRFSDEMLGRNYVMTWTFADGTEKVINLDLFASNQKNCLEVHTGDVNVPAGNKKRVEGLKYENICQADLGITSIKLAWTNNSGMNFTEYSIEDSTGALSATPNKSNDQVYDMGYGDLYYRDGEGQKSNERFSFNQDVNCTSAQTEFTATFALVDGTEKTKVFSACGSGGEEVDFDITDGEVVPNECVNAEIKVLGAAISYSGSYDIPVTTKLNIGDQSIEAWGSFENPIAANVNDNGNPRTYTVSNMDPATPISITGRSWIKKRSTYSGSIARHWKIYMTKSSNVDNSYVWVLRNGDNVPQVQGFMNQSSILDFVSGYVTNGKIVLDDNEAIFLFEIGTSNLGSTAADFQDLVMLVTFNAVSCN